MNPQEVGAHTTSQFDQGVLVALKGVSINDQLRDILGTFYMQLSDWRYGIYTYILSGGKSGKKCTDPNQKAVGIIFFHFFFNWVSNLAQSFGRHNAQ